VSKEPNLRKDTVKLKQGARASRPRPSIRREPPPQPQTALAKKLDRIDFSSPEWEVRLALAGIIFFALALTAVVFDLGEFLKLGL
jgi:hypothetical protein